MQVSTMSEHRDQLWQDFSPKDCLLSFLPAIENVSLLKEKKRSFLSVHAHSRDFLAILSSLLLELWLTIGCSG